MQTVSRSLRWALIAVFGPLAACNREPKPEATAAVPEGKVEPEAPAPKPAVPAAAAALDDDALATTYRRWKAKFEEDASIGGAGNLAEARRELEVLANRARDLHLRANGALLLGAILEAHGQAEAAEAYYRLAAHAIPQDAGPKMALALALAAQAKFAEAAAVQREATALDPDNLENWLTLGELLVKAGEQEAAAQTYVDYERRRKGLIDGLTLTKDGVPLVARDERIGCAEALASATDEGTAVALAYALDKDPEPAVRATVARVMGIQRLAWFRTTLETRLGAEPDAEVREALTWALAEIARDPVTVTKPPKGP